ncbi:MAG TPA: MBL fold metallo-hydrolase [Candidatus Anaerostipes avistercoris]|uniref:MBL fold metallo-hydrolase n=1 Tax=Candidatus Anaerostipes avistercoris TaxID=2838462 RepID=A0A9D2PKT1_9FIRM|nr:MBL fold metallo-hydrolase [uncultured Anaerostipes sp.]HJC51230.1 MBL fold metallo-hydrolase [Candidatus Anaerostipes avistercoris]
MKLMFIGADHEVTGSCHYVEACGKRFVVDYGMEQGVNIYENAELPVGAAKLDFVLLTHAHIDHSGMLPLLYARGFRGPVYATKATTDLCQIMLRDSAHIQESEAEWKNRKALRSGKPEVVPVYTMDDAVNVMEQFVPCSYEHKIQVCSGIEIRFTDIGHLLGSSSIEVWLSEEDVCRKLVFSGDIGNTNQPLIKDPHYTDEADYVIMESTYGDRYHEAHPNYVDELAEVIQRTFDRKGNVVIPSFAVGRTQELLYYIRQIKSEGLVKNHGDFKVIVDSPLAVEATQIFNKDLEETYDEDAMELVRQGINPITFSNLQLSITTEESKAINFDEESKVIISAAGMCDAGRIRHHLKHNLWKPENTIVFVGYQSYGTLGRALVEGTKEVKLFGETIKVQAEILRLEGISGHADKKGLIRWIREFKKQPEMVFVVHGEDKVCDAFAECLKQDYGLQAKAPYSGDTFDLASGRWTAWGSRELVKKKARPQSSAYIRLKTAAEKLQAVVEHNEGGANKDLAKFADQILALCDKWDR